MWMMGYNESGEFNMPDTFTGRKFRPLMPRPTAAPPPNPPCFSSIHGSTDVIALNHHLVSAAMAEQSKREFNTQQVVVSSRWNPTPEQLQTLEELYRRGTRTPTAEQIQQITAQLRRYGKIEGKNVFYWFQNHKARERQKRRRELESAPDEQPRNVENLERKESGASRTGFEVEQTKNWATPTNCSTIPEKTVSIQRGSKAAAAAGGTECRGAEGWVHFEEPDVQQRRIHLMERNDTWQLMRMSCSPPTNLIINSTNNTAAAVATTSAAAPTVDGPAMHARGPHHQDLNIYIREGNDVVHRLENEDNCSEECQTLQLFPLRSGEDGGEKEGHHQDSAAGSMDSCNFTPFQFFEFLPLKN